MKRSKTALFLMETMFAILFFAVAGTVCLQLFVQAHTFSQNATRLDEAVTVCQSAASILESGDFDALPEFYENGSLENGQFTVPFGADGRYALRVTDGDTSYWIQALDGKEEIFSLFLLKRYEANSAERNTP